MKTLGILLTFGLAACPIPPDFPVDAGPDSGSLIFITDAGVDAGTDIVRATLTTSSSTSSTSLAWDGSDLASTSIDSEGATGPSQVTISASNGFYGTFKLTLGSLVPGSTSSGTVLSVTYEPASGPDSWTCGPSNACTGVVALSSYDGSTIVGTFTITFPADSFAVSAELSSGSFDVLLP